MIDSICNFLFSETKLKPQLGFAGMNKKAWLWLPGKDNAVTEEMSSKMNSPIKGCTQLAFESWFDSAASQVCEICWFGLDIDKDDNEDVDLVEWSLAFAEKHNCSMVRLSCSGEGVHMIWKLAEPIRCGNSTAGKIVVALAKPMKEAAEADGIHVCQANRRMFWLVGGSNETIYKSSSLYKTDIVVSELPVMKSRQVVDVTPQVQEFVDMFKDAGVLIGDIKDSNPIYVGDAVKVLREAGETVYTKSGCSGNGDINGFINILGNRICLFAFADNQIIWNYDDIGSMFT